MSLILKYALSLASIVSSSLDERAQLITRNWEGLGTEASARHSIDKIQCGDLFHAVPEYRVTSDSCDTDVNTSLNAIHV